jgi:ubiquinol-cytochrome c reductase cytochrome c subunit
VTALVTIAGPSLQAEHNPGRVMAAVEVGPSHMPRFEYLLSVEQMQAVSDFVASKLAVIPMEAADLSRGGDVFRTYCASCHRTAVRGGALAFCGINAPSLTGKSAALVAGAIRWGPGPMPAFPRSVIDDKDLNAVVNYIRYAQQPYDPGGQPMNWYGPVAEGFAAWVGVLALVFVTAWIEKGGKG